jgi:hypothetical protein
VRPFPCRTRQREILSLKMFRKIPSYLSVRPLESRIELEPLNLPAVELHFKARTVGGKDPLSFLSTKFIRVKQPCM